MTRNSPCYSLIDAPHIVFDRTPLVTLKKTAARKAIREMEWFLSGDSQCPPELLDWWDGQLYYVNSNEGYYYYGYAHQFRDFGGCGYVDGFDLSGRDQVKKLIIGIKEHPHSRRNVMTTWHPEEMALIAEHNNNPNTPATCHGTIIQAFVRKGELSLKTYQRSADLILGVPHNWIQYWALLLWLCNQCDLAPDRLLWMFGDAHIYDEPSHLEVANAIINAPHRKSGIELQYSGDKADFNTSDFRWVGIPPEPVTRVRAVRL